MKTPKTFLASLLSCWTLMAMTTSVQATSLVFMPNHPTVEVGQTQNMGIWIQDMEEGTDLGAFDFTVQYNPNILSFISYSLGPNLGDLSIDDAFDVSSGEIVSGSVNLAEFSFLWDLSGQQDSFYLGTLNFNAIAPGTTALSFSDISMGDYYGNPLTMDTLSGKVSVAAPVPEPSTSLLFILGLLGFSVKFRNRIK